MPRNLCEFAGKRKRESMWDSPFQTLVRPVEQYSGSFGYDDQDHAKDNSLDKTDRDRLSDTLELFHFKSP
jgi:hypothetical protein